MKPFVHIFMDDLRQCPKSPHWLLARCAEGTLDLLEAFRGRVKTLSLDHDLGDKALPEKHGKWLVNQMIDKGLYADVIYLHTANGEGRKNMYSYLMQAIEHGAIPAHVKVLAGPHPSYYLKTGDLLED
jgi:hypothetical protein